MRLTKKIQVFCNTADRVSGVPGDFSINIPVHLDYTDNVQYKIYLQSYCVRNDFPSVTANNCNFEIGITVTGNTTWTPYALPLGNPSVLDILKYLQQTCNLSYTTFNTVQGKFNFNELQTFALRFTVAKNCAQALGFVSGQTYSQPTASVNIVAISKLQTLDLACSVGGDRYSTTNSKFSNTTLVASAAVLVPFLGNITYVDIDGANGLFVDAATLDNVQIKLYDNTKTELFPVLDWSFVIAVETWVDDLAEMAGGSTETRELLKQVADFLQLLTVGQGLQNEQTQASGAQTFTVDPNVENPHEAPAGLPPPSDPEPPPDYYGLIPAEAVDVLPQDLYAVKRQRY